MTDPLLLAQRRILVLEAGMRRIMRGTDCSEQSYGYAWEALHAEGSTNVASQHAELLKIIAKGYAVVQDFMPNIGNCALQDYKRLNEFLIEARSAINP